MLTRLQTVFSSFERREVRYVVIGGIAAVLHGIPRATFDLEILIEPTAENVRNLLDGLSEAGFGTSGLTSVEEVLGHEITIFEDRVRIDVQTSTPGLTFERAWQNRVRMDYEGQGFYVVCKDDLIAAKRAAGRDVARQDVALLEQV